MKLRYILGIILSAFLYTGCSDDDPVGTLDAIQLDQTFVTIPADGGSATVTVNATDSWSFDNIFDDADKNKNAAPVPTWLTVSQVSGSAGQTTITFSAEKVDGGREAGLQISVGGQKQFLVVRQGSLEASQVTIAEALQGSIGRTYRVTGTISGTYSNYEQYGNYYIKDGDSEILVYGTADKDGKLKNYPWKSWGLEVGDVVTVEGPLGEYKGTPQLIDVTIIELKKGLIKLMKESSTIGKDGGEMEVVVAYKGSGAFVDIPAESQDWVQYVSTKYVAGVKTIFETNPADTAIFKFQVAPNAGDKRKAVLTFSSYSGESSSELDYTLTQDANVLPHGMNPADPYSVAEAIKKCQEIGSTSDGEIYYAKGRISSIKEVSTSYGNATFNISDDGTDNNALTCFRSLSLDNQKFTAEDEIAVGDEVVVCGKLVNFADKNGNITPEFSGNVYIYSLKKGGGSTPTPQGADGSKIVTVAEFNAAAESTDVWYQLTGTVKNLKANDQYGNFDLEDATGSVYVYGVLSEKGGAKKKFQELVAAKGIKEGSKLTIVGTRGSYNGKIEVMNAYFVSVSN